MTRPEYEAQRALEARRGRPYAVKLGEKCGVRYDNEPAPMNATPADTTPTVKVKPAPTGAIISQERPAQPPAQKCQGSPTGPGNAPTGGAGRSHRNRRRPRQKPATQAQNAPTNATGE